MKSRVINSKHLIVNDNDIVFGYTSRLKPSLFYYDKPEEARRDLYIQFIEHENKMVLFTFTGSFKLPDDPVFDHVDIFTPTKKFKEKFEWCNNMKLFIKYDACNSRSHKKQKEKKYND